jgi:four helix bundle protein
MGIRSYRDLEVWNVAMDLAAWCYGATRQFPREEMFGLTSQIRRAASSIPANIAEGHGRNSTREFLRHLSIARGSLMELETHVLLAVRVNRMEPTESKPLLELAERVGRMLYNLKTSLERRL